MPHATTPPTGFQAFILCGPGESLNPFNSNPKEFPKCLIPIANRPMVWYPMEWCHRMGISSIHLITPPDCAAALDAALSQNPYLTSLPSPKPTLLVPENLSLTTGTAELFRLPEVQTAITGDFVVLPCDIICELGGSSLLESWMTLQGSSHRGSDLPDHRGGLGVWYETKGGNEGSVGMKKEETDFLATTQLPRLPAALSSNDTIVPRIRNVALSMPTDTLKDAIEEQKSLQMRAQLLRKHGRVKMHVSHRDAHMYFLPYWVKAYLQANESFESIGEDMLGWWAKAGWQSGLANKLGMDHALRPAKRRKSDLDAQSANEGFDLVDLSSTNVADLNVDDSVDEGAFASRVVPSLTSNGKPDNDPVAVPSILSYLHPPHNVPSPSNPQSSQKQKQQSSKQQKQQQPEPAQQPSSPLIRRVDTVPLLLAVSLYLARLASFLEQFTTSNKSHPYCHAQQVHPTTQLPSQATIHTPTCLLDANSTLAPRITLRDTVVGANCSIASGSRLHGCLLMDGCVVEEKVVMSGCVLGRYCKVGRGAELKDCWVQEGYAVAEEAVVKGEILAGFAGVEEGASDDDGDVGGGLDLGGS